MIQMFTDWECCFLEILFLRFYLFLDRGEGRVKEGEGHHCVKETLIGCLSHSPNRGLGLQPSRVPWPGIKPATFCLSGWCATKWTIRVRAFSRSLHKIFSFSLRPMYWAPWFLNVCFRRPDLLMRRLTRVLCVIFMIYFVTVEKNMEKWWKIYMYIFHAGTIYVEVSKKDLKLDVKKSDNFSTA